MAVLSLILLTLLITFILLFPQLSPFPYDTVNWNAMRLHPNLASGHYLGTDNLGRDLLVRTAMGGRVSLLVGVISALMAVIIGTLYGALAGYLGGWVDRVMMRGLEILDAAALYLSGDRINQLLRTQYFIDFYCHRHRFLAKYCANCPRASIEFKAKRVYFSRPSLRGFLGSHYYSALNPQCFRNCGGLRLAVNPLDDSF